MDENSSITLAGRTICQGLAIGPAFVHRANIEGLADSYGIEAREVGEQLRRLERATEAVAIDLQTSARRIESETSEKLAAIFEVHEAMLRDPGLQQEVRSLVESDLIRAEHALARVFRGREQKFRQMTEASHRQHADDVADLAQRLLRELAGIKVTPLERMPPGRVLVAQHLLPSDTVALPARGVVGIVAEFGGPGSHVALLAEALGIPTVTGVSEVMTKVADNDLLLVDGFCGAVILKPDTPTQKECQTRSEGAAARRILLLRAARQVAHTRSGKAVRVMANVSRFEDTAAAADNGADGVGLCRLEAFYMSRKTPPTADQLLGELRRMFAPMAGKPITVRLLDIGGDKPVAFLKLPPENNPVLGLRGVRVLLQYPELLDTQLQALSRFAREQDLRILVPMVSRPEDLAQVRRRLETAAGERGTKPPPLGAMIETPGAALSVDDMKTQADFFSIGTNDLTQYTFAAGRENPLVSDYFQDAHPAILKLIRMVVEQADNLPVSVCGELARNLEAIPALLELGIRNLSVAAPLIPEVKAAIRHLAE